jgi:hypothetical protein
LLRVLWSGFTICQDMGYLVMLGVNSVFGVMALLELQNKCHVPEAYFH